VATSPASQKEQDEDYRVIDVYGAAASTTYDIIGKIAIDHDFNSLGEPHGEGGMLFEAYEHMQKIHQGSGGLWTNITTMWPVLDKIWVSYWDDAQSYLLD
jgi:hypothetical protein